MKKKSKELAEVKKKEIAVINTASSPADMIRLAVSGGADLDKLEKLLILQERYEANEARKIYNSSFTSAQEKIMAVTKTKLNPQTHSKYAPLENIIKTSMPIYTKEGFSVIFYEGETSAPECIRICADVLHRAGHKETYHYDIPLDGLGIKGNPNMTRIHAKASSTLYARRYLMCMIWNIPTQDDDDGNRASGEAITRPSAISEKSEVKPEVPKPGLSEKIKNDFAKARKLLGDEQFFKMLGEQGCEKIEEIAIPAIALQILKDMGDYYKQSNE